MSKATDEKKIKAFELYKKGLKLTEIAEKLNVPQGTIRVWKNRYSWEDETLQKNVTKRNAAKCNVTKKKGGQPNNINAIGNSGGTGAPKENQNALKHGIWSKYLPAETLEIAESVLESNILDVIWDSIRIQYGAIMRSQYIMYVKDKDDCTTTQIGASEGKTTSETWEVQQAWDKQANFLKVQSVAITALKNLVKDYLEMEGASKADAKEQVQDWKAAIVEIARRRKEKGEEDGRTDSDS